MKRAALGFLLGLGGVVWASAATPAAHVVPHIDLGFEQPQCTGPWRVELYNYQNYEASIAEPGRSGRTGARLRYKGTAPWSKEIGMGLAHQRIPTEAVVGKRMRLSGFLRTEGVSKGHAGLWVQVYSPEKLLREETMAAGGVQGTTPWTRYEVEIDVPAEAETVYVGAHLSGDGTAWADDFSIEVNGAPLKDGPPLSSVPTEAEVAWLRQNAVPFATTEPGKGFADLQPWKKVIGDARIVALGEATHGTRDFFRMKHRLTEWLATEMGFTIFAIEANMPESYRINEYVLTGKGDPKELLKGIYFWTWNTQEVLDMILWMREFNRSGKGRIQFLGVDLQTPDVAIENVKKLAGQADPGLVPQLDEAYAPFAGWDRKKRDPEKTAQRDAGAQRGLEIVEAAREKLAARLGKEQADWAIQNARIVVQATGMFRVISRDAAMAKNVEWILDQNPGAKVVLWAHNRHIYRREGYLGWYLGQRHPGREMVVLAFTHHEGGYNTAPATSPAKPSLHQAPPAEPQSVEGYLRHAGMPLFLLDLRSVTVESPAAPWLAADRPFRNLGSLYFPCGYERENVSQHYDGMIYIEKTSPSALLPL